MEKEKNIYDGIGWTRYPNSPKWVERSYYLGNKATFRGKRERLHRYIWRKKNGEVPKGFIVHHIDGNPLNNSISNLGIMERGEHAHHHWTKEKREWARENIKTIIELASQWSKTPTGKKRRRELGLQNAHFMYNRPIIERKCDLCRKKYFTKYPERGRFCHLNCRQKALRWSRTRLQSENEKWYVSRKWNNGK